MISVLNSVSQLNAENALSSTQASLQNSLTQLSTGLKINSGADDPAGLSIAAGLGANIAALTQSSQNASNSVGLLQTADGALSQVTSLLNQAITLATEASNGQLTVSQSTAANTAYQSILSEITQIGATTNFNGTAVFSATPVTTFTSDGTAGGTTTTSTTTGALSSTTLALNASVLTSPAAAAATLTAPLRRNQYRLGSPRHHRRIRQPVDRGFQRARHRSHQPDQRAEQRAERRHRDDRGEDDAVQRPRTDRHGGPVAVQPG